MKKAIFILITLVHFSFPLLCQYVNIPDINLLNVLIEEGVDVNADNLISNAEAEATNSLVISWSDITDLTGIEAFIYLDTLDFSGNPINSLDVSGFSELTRLICSCSLLSVLNVSNCSALTHLSCRNNQLSSLELCDNTSLTDLYCDGNQLSSLDVANNISLAQLDCSGNQLTDLNVSDCTVLERLTCYGNLLTNLEVSNCISLTYLSCWENQLSSLNVSTNIALTILDISGMPDLFEVCVRELPFPHDSAQVNVLNSPNAYYKDCVAPELWVLMDTMNNSDSVQAISSEDGILYLVPLNTDKDLAIIHEAVIDSVSAVGDSAVLMSVSELGNGIFWIYARDTTGNLSEPGTFTIMRVGLNPAITGHSSVYPNPAHDQITVQTSLIGEYSIILTSLSGRLYINEHISGNSFHLDLSSFPEGVYFITVMSKDVVTTHKIIKIGIARFNLMDALPY